MDIQQMVLARLRLEQGTYMKPDGAYSRGGPLGRFGRATPPFSGSGV